jgi:hypothetical protein
MSNLDCITNRIYATFSLPVEVAYAVSNSVNTIGGIALSALSALTVGMHLRINDQASRFSHSSCSILPPILEGLARIAKPTYIRSENEGKATFTNKYYNDLYSQGVKFRRSSETGLVGFCERQVASRLVFFSSALLSIATRIADFAIGIFGALRAIFYLGQNNEYNNFAINHLNIFSVIEDVLLGLRGTVNPASV